MTTTDIQTACVGETQMALYHKALGERGEEIREALHSGKGCDGVTIVDDQSDRPWNQEWTICVIADVTCDDGVQRIAYYHDGARDVLDDGDGMDSCEDWAKAWDDVDGLVPAYLGISEDDDNG